jgi:hypothetical protein
MHSRFRGVHPSFYFGERMIATTALTNCGFCSAMSQSRVSASNVSRCDDPHHGIEGNLNISIRLWAPLSLLEVSVRNLFSNTLIDKYGVGFFRTGCGLLSEPHAQKLRHAQEVRWSGDVPINVNRIVSNLNFGFWVGLLSKHYESTLWSPCLSKVFSPGSRDRKQLEARMRDALLIRNRVAHHELMTAAKYSSATSSLYDLLALLNIGVVEVEPAGESISAILRLPLHPVE